MPAEEVKDPERTIPRATIIGTVARDACSTSSRRSRSWASSRTDQLAASTSPFADAAGQIFGGGWDKVIALVAMISTFGALNGWILLQGRVPLAAAEDGMFPKPFARVHGERRTPVFGLVVSSVLVTGLMLMNYTKGLVDAFTFVILLATLTTLVPYAFSAAAQAWLWLVERERSSVKHLVRDVVDRDAGLRLQRVGDRRRGRRHRHQGLRAPAVRHPGLHRRCAGGRPARPRIARPDAARRRRARADR